MPSKYQIISEMAAREALDITSSPEKYMAFLNTAANNYKYDFREQLLIHAQKPDATACAQIEVWNRLGRWVNKGTRGIALLVENGNGYRLRHVFDISHTNSRAGRTVTLWRMREEYVPQVEESLRNSFGEFEEQSNFAGSVIAATTIVVDDNLPDYLEQLSTALAESPQTEAEPLVTQFREILRVSVSYMVMVRSGMDPDPVFTPEFFRDATAFRSPETISILGQAGSDMAEMILREIEEAVKAIQREEISRTFANPTPVQHNGRTNTERSNKHGTDLQAGGRLSAAEPDRSGEPEDWEVWNAAARVPPESQERNLHRDDAQRQAQQPSGGNRPDGDRPDGNPDYADGEGRGRDGSSEGIGSDAVGSADEQHPEPGGGDRAGGADLRLTDSEGEPLEEPPSEEPPVPGYDFSIQPSGLQLSNHDFDARSEIPYYHYDAEKNELLRTSDALKDHRVEIAAFFADHEDRQERGDFIRSFFDNTYVEKILESGQRAGYRAYDDLLTMWRGSYPSREMEVFTRWPSVANAVYGMILMEEWLDPDERQLPTEGEQIALIAEAQAEKETVFVLPQAAIDYILCGGSGVTLAGIYVSFLIRKQ